ncbi:VOC family protein [Ilumatobacter sp.]|uniref:VOC family protein n=1 Tax=Ilumatobacter sp. TaxID=1967498 RepID=UPI003C3F9820
MTTHNGIHHLAVATADIKAQIDFFNDVLGCELVALYWMHGVEGAWHGFLKLSDTCSIAFVQTPDIAGIERTIGVTHAGSGAGPCAGGAMQHVAFNVDTLDDLLAMRDRIRSRGITVFGPLDHGMCHSIYFAGPEDLSLEVATSEKPLDGRAWIDPEVVGLAGISPDELERYRNPDVFEPTDTPVPQPAFDPDRPWPRGIPQEAYVGLIGMPDEVVTQTMSENTPPVLIDG